MGSVSGTMTNLSLHLGVNSQAWAVLHLLQAYEESIESLGVPLMRADSYAWYNGRERGISIVVSQYFEKMGLVCVFGECRNSDSIFVDVYEKVGAAVYESKKGTFAPSYLDAGYEEAYRKRKFFNPGEAGKAADFVWKKIQAWAKVQRKAIEKKAVEEAANP